MSKQEIAVSSDNSSPGVFPRLRRLFPKFHRKTAMHDSTQMPWYELEERWRILAENVADTILIVDRDGTILFINRTQSDFRVEEAIGTNFYDYIVPEDRPIARRTLEQSFKKKARGQYESWGAGPDRTTALYDCRVVPIERDGQVIAVNAIITNITNRRMAENALQYRMQFEELIATLSTNFINCAPEEVGTGIDHALKVTGEFAGVDRSCIFLFSDDQTQLTNIHEWCAKGIESQIGNLQRIPLESTSWWMEKLNKFENIHIPCVADLPFEAQAEKEQLQLRSVKSIIVVPLIYRHSLMGWVGFDSVKSEKTWTDENIALLKIVGEMISNALARKRQEAETMRLQETLRFYASHVVKAQEEERGRLARELHDDTMQNLLLISNRLKEIDVGTYGQLPSQVRGQMEKLREFTEQTMGSVRRFTQDLRPLMLDDMGLVPTLEWLIARLKDEFCIEADVKIIGKERRLNPDTEFALFRIAQEALNNIRKHANASVVNAVLEFCHESIRMIVYDNGQGFEMPDIPTHFARQGKLGIAGISERVRLLGGTFEVDSQPGGGTTLKVEIQG